MTTILGRITNIYDEANGSALLSDVPIGATQLVVNDAFDFSADGGTLEILEVEYTYLSVDYETDTITLEVPTTVAFLADEQVLALPFGTSKMALVELNDSDEGIVAEVPFHSYDLFPPGVRDSKDMETVTVNDDFGYWQIDRMMGQNPLRDAKHIDPDTVLDAGLTPLEVHLQTVAEVEADFQEAYDAIQSGDTANQQAIDAVVIDYTTKFVDVDTAIDDAVDEVTAAYQDADQVILDAVNNLPVPLKKTESTSAPGSTANTAGEVWERYDNLGATNRKLIGAWRGLGGTSWVPVNLDPVYIPQLDVNTGTFGTLGVNRLVVTDSQDFIKDPSFDGLGVWGSTGGWSIIPSATGTDSTGVPGGKVFTNTGTGSGYRLAVHPRFPVRPGDKFNLEAAAYLGALTAGSGTLADAGVIWTDAAGVTITSFAVLFTISDTKSVWTKKSTELTAPAGAVYAVPYVQAQPGWTAGTIYVDDMHIRRKGGGELIVDGTIYGKHIATQSLTADKVFVSDLTNYAADMNVADVRTSLPALTPGTPWVFQLASASEGWRRYVSLVPSVGNIHAAQSFEFNVVPGQIFNVSLLAYRQNATGLLGYGIRFKDAAGTVLQYGGQSNFPAASPANVWQSGSVDVTVPANAKTAFVECYADSTSASSSGVWYTKDWMVRRKFGGELVIDGSLTARHIQAKSISTDKMLISDLTNLVIDPGFSGFGWQYSAGTGAGLPYIDGTTTDMAGGASGVLVFATGPASGSSSAALTNPAIPVIAGEMFGISWEERIANTPVTGDFLMRVHWYNSALTWLSSYDTEYRTAASMPTTWAIRRVTTNMAPANSAFARLEIIRYGNMTTGNILINNVRMNRRFGGELVVDGTVRARHITADMVNGLLATLGAIQTNENGAPYGTTPTGIKISTSGIIGYSPGGSAMTSISTSTGRISAVGGFGTATGYDDISIVPGDFYTPAAIKFYSDGPFYDTANNAQIWHYDSATSLNGPTTTYTVRFIGAKSVGSGTRPRIDISTHITNATSNVVRADVEYHAGGSGGWKGGHFHYIDGTIITNTQEKGMTFGASGACLGLGVDAGWIKDNMPAYSVYALGMMKASGKMEVDNGFFDLGSLYNGWASGGLHAAFNASGRLVGVSSSRRFKHDIEPLTLEVSRRALDLESITYVPNEELDMGSDRVPGFIAEQAAEAGMDLWVARDYDGSPIGFKYIELTTAHNMLIKDLYKKIEELERKINA